MDRKFSYKIRGVSNENGLIGGIKKCGGVLDCYIEDGRLYYVLDDHTDEYDIFVEANELCARYDGVIDFGDEGGADEQEPTETPDQAEEYFGETEVQERKNVSAPAADVSEQKPRKGLFDEEDDDFNVVDKIVSRKKKFKQETYIRIGELAIAVILFVVALILPGEAGEFGFKTIVGVLAFAIGGYELFYSAITDLIRKKFFSENVVMTLAALLGALLGYVFETTALVVAFAIAKAIETVANGIAEGKIEETFYTGSVELNIFGGGHKKIDEIVAGDVLILNRFDVVPCDGVAAQSAKLDVYRVSDSAEAQAEVGDRVLAGSVVLSDELKMTVEKTNAESQLCIAKKHFLASLDETVKPPEALTIITAAFVFLSLAATFLMPLIVGGTYSEQMREWGARAIGLLAISAVSYEFFLGMSCIKNAMIAARRIKINFSDAESMQMLAKTNSFEFPSSVLTDGENVKEDVYGCMNELLALGVKNVNTRFDCELPEEAAAKLRFKQNKVKNENVCRVGDLITIKGGGKVDILVDELSFIPLAYRIAKRAIRRKNLTFIVKIISFVALIAAMAVVPSAALNPIYLGAISAAISALSAILLIISLGGEN